MDVLTYYGHARSQNKNTDLLMILARLWRLKFPYTRMWIRTRDRNTTNTIQRLWQNGVYANGAHLMAGYSTRPMNKVWAFRRTSCSSAMCCIFSCRMQNEQRLYFLTRSRPIWHKCPTLQFKLQVECVMGWYRYTPHSDIHHAECEKTCSSQLRSKTLQTWIRTATFPLMYVILAWVFT